MSACVVAIANSATPTALISPPTSMNGLRTFSRSDSTPPRIMATAWKPQYQLPSALARAEL